MESFPITYGLESKVDKKKQFPVFYCRQYFEWLKVICFPKNIPAVKPNYPNEVKFFFLYFLFKATISCNTLVFVLKLCNNLVYV